MLHNINNEQNVLISLATQLCVQDIFSVGGVLKKKEIILFITSFFMFTDTKSLITYSVFFILGLLPTQWNLKVLVFAYFCVQLSNEMKLPRNQCRVQG